MATLYGVGVGPGDPLLLTLKAVKLIQQAPVVCYLAAESGQAQAKHIAREAFAMRSEEQAEKQQHIVITMPMSLDRTAANQAYDQGAKAIYSQLAEGNDVVFLCEGDPLFFGSFSYLLQRLAEHVTVEIVPGISSVHAAASALQLPLTLQKESFAVISGRHTDEQIRQALINHDSLVIMKAGAARPRILALLADTQRTEEANYLEYISRDNQLIQQNVDQLAAEAGPYFSLFVVTRHRETDRAMSAVELTQ